MSRTHKAKEIYSDDNFQLIYSPSFNSGSGNVPKQIFINAKNEENSAKIDNALELTQTVKKPMKNYFYGKMVMDSHIIAEETNATINLFKKHESLLIHIFGEDIIANIERNMKNSRKAKKTNSVT